jgi:hypothetical protein
MCVNCDPALATEATAGRPRPSTLLRAGKACGCGGLRLAQGLKPVRLGESFDSLRSLRIPDPEPARRVVHMGPTKVQTLRAEGW